MFKYIKNGTVLYEFLFSEMELYTIMCKTPIHRICMENTPFMDMMGPIEGNFTIYQTTIDLISKEYKNIPPIIKFIFWEDMVETYRREEDTEYSYEGGIDVEVLYYFFFGKKYSTLVEKYRKYCRSEGIPFLHGQCDKEVIEYFFKGNKNE